MIALLIILFYVIGFIISLIVGGILFKHEDAFVIAYSSLFWPLAAPIVMVLFGGSWVVGRSQRWSRRR